MQVGQREEEEKAKWVGGTGEGEFEAADGD